MQQSGTLIVIKPQKMKQAASNALKAIEVSVPSHEVLVLPWHHRNLKQKSQAHWQVSRIIVRNGILRDMEERLFLSY